MTRGLPWKVAWVTGASSGIGRETALQLAGAGVRVAVSARSAEKLDAMGNGITAYPLDVTDGPAVAAVAARIEAELGPIDLAVLGAGTYSPVEAGDLRSDLFAQTMDVNYMGVVHAAAALIPLMRQRRAGHVAWIASVAGYRGLPKAAAYGPSKAALINLAESLKPELARDGIIVSVINPGFVETPLTAQNDFPMPFLMKPEEAARATIRGLAAGRFEIAYPWPFVMLLRIARALPYPAFFYLIDKAVLGRRQP